MYKVYVCVPFLSFYEGNVRIVFFLLHMSMLLLRKKPIVLGSSMKMDGMTVTRVIMIDLRHNPQRIHFFFAFLGSIAVDAVFPTLKMNGKVKHWL